MIKMGVGFVIGVVVCVVVNLIRGKAVDGIFRFDTEAEQPITMRLSRPLDDILRKRFVRLKVESNIMLTGRAEK